jgi:hypothetical protein
MVEAIEKDEIFLLEPPIVKTVPMLKGLLPPRIFDWVADRLGVSTSMNTWRGHS